MADLQSGVPQAIEDRFRDRLAPGGLLVGQEEQQIDVGAGRLQAAAVAAGGDHRHVLGLGRILRLIEMLAREFEQQADDFVFQPAQPLGAAPSVAVVEQQLLGFGAAFVERGLQPLRQRGTQFAPAAAMGLGQAFQVGGDRAEVDQFARMPGRLLGSRARAGFEGERGHGGIGIAECEGQVTRSPQRYSLTPASAPAGGQFLGISWVRKGRRGSP